MKEGYLYILRSVTSGTYYVGSTPNLSLRLKQHDEGKSLATKNRGPWETCFSQRYDTLVAARRAEFQLKRQKSRVFIERVVQEGHFDMGN